MSYVSSPTKFNYRPAINPPQTIVNNKLILPEHQVMQDISNRVKPKGDLFAKPMPLQKTAKKLTSDENVVNNKLMNSPLQTPCKKTPQRRFYVNESPQPEKQQKLELIINNKQVNTQFFAAGSYLEAFDIHTPEHPSLIENVPNYRVLLKSFLKKHAGDKEKCQKYIRTGLGNHHRALELDLPCATIFNMDTADKDMFYLVEKIPCELDLNSESQLDQIGKFFEVSHKNSYLCDLAYGNLRVKEDGTVTLIDNVEKNFDYNDRNKYRIFAIQFLKTWVKYCVDNNKGRETANRLLHRFTDGLGFEQDWIEAALNEYYMKVTQSFHQ